MLQTHNRDYSHIESQSTPYIRRKTTAHQILHTKGMTGKNKFTSESIILYNPHRDKGLNSSREKNKKWWNK